MHCTWKHMHIHKLRTFLISLFPLWQIPSISLHWFLPFWVQTKWIKESNPSFISYLSISFTNSSFGSVLIPLSIFKYHVLTLVLSYGLCWYLHIKKSQIHILRPNDFLGFGVTFKIAWLTFLPGIFHHLKLKFPEIKFITYLPQRT